MLLAGDTSDMLWTADELAGFFQRFRPDGHKLESLFADIPGGLDVLSRLRRVYTATTIPPADPRRCDLYFIIRDPRRAPDEESIRIAGNQLLNWRQIATDFHEHELVELLTPIPRIQISKGPAPNLDPKDYNTLDVFIYDVQTDWHATLKPLCPEARWMGEAFYNIGCDYYLARYITWPWYMHSSRINEAYEPYFELWLHGSEFRCPSPDNITLFVPSRLDQPA